MTDYHSDTEYLSKTGLTVFIDSPYEYYMQYISCEMPRRKPTAAMVVGSVAHSVLLEQTTLDEIAVAYDESCFNKDGGLNGKRAEAFRDAHSGKHILRPSELDGCRRIIDAVKNSPIVKTIASCEAKEAEYRATIHGVKCKCKVDMLHVGDVVSAYDLKFMDNISPSAFYRSAKAFKYWLQDVHYGAILRAIYRKPVEFQFIAIETKKPYRNQTYMYSPAQLEQAKDFHQLKLGGFAVCQSSGNWSDNWSCQIPLAPWEVGYSGEGELVEYDGDEE